LHHSDQDCYTLAKNDKHRTSQSTLIELSCYRTIQGYGRQALISFFRDIFFTSELPKNSFKYSYFDAVYQIIIKPLLSLFIRIFKK
jgi:hypothetical protein